MTTELQFKRDIYQQAALRNAAVERAAALARTIQKGARVPLHIPQDDMSQDAIVQRVELHQTMAQINPKGFRQFSTKKGSTKKALYRRKGNTKVRVEGTRLERMAASL